MLSLTMLHHPRSSMTVSLADTANRDANISSSYSYHILPSRILPSAFDNWRKLCSGGQFLSRWAPVLHCAVSGVSVTGHFLGSARPVAPAFRSSLYPPSTLWFHAAASRSRQRAGMSTGRKWKSDGIYTAVGVIGAVQCGDGKLHEL